MSRIIDKLKSMLFSREPLARVSRYFFFLAFGICLGLSALQAGLIIGIRAAGWSEIVLVHLVLLYWVLAALFLTWMIHRMIRKHYELPARRIQDAARRIAHGDFSVQIPLVHEEEEKQDFFDETISDVNTMAQELSSIETLKTDFISNVSHEMKTPLSVIKNYAELLQISSLSDEKRLEYTAVVEENAGKMAYLVTNILRLNRIENQRIVPEKKEYDLVRQLTDCILGFETKWDEKEIDLIVEMEDDCRIVSDESLLELVWNNLFSNAVKFTEKGGTISITQRSEGDRILVSVEDSGCGMSEETLKHVFDKFYQGDTSHATEGNGLGLALVLRVLSLLGGEIRADSREGEGSCFTVFLPALE